MKETNFDRYLKARMKDPAFAEAFQRASEDWDVALQLTVLRKQAGLSQAALARKMNTSQQQICRLESSNYQGHSLRTLKKVAKVLQAQVYIVLVPLKAAKGA
jgi:DNA-binding XRE family transcriptional regulator